MSGAGHTPGPWFAFLADWLGHEHSGPHFVVGPRMFQTVAEVRPGSDDDDLPAQTPANAWLMAAAPDLLAAVMLGFTMRVAADKLMLDPGAEQVRAYVAAEQEFADAASAAIAKAEGRS